MHTLTIDLNFNSKYYQKILWLLQQGDSSARLVGGCVRDALLRTIAHKQEKSQNLTQAFLQVPNVYTTDIDIATTLLPEQVIDVLSNNKIRVIPTGIKFGTVTAFIEDEKFEITTLRKDLECDGRHAKVEFTDSFYEDALRRDFTINALSYSLDHKLYDYFNGISDLKERKVVFVGDPYQRITEDYLRILRFFRFSCYYANSINEEGLKACAKLKSGIISLSKERIKVEMDKLIIADTSPTVLLRMYQEQILPIIFPIKHFNCRPLDDALAFAKIYDVNLSYLARYAIILYNNNLVLQDLLKLKMSRQESQGIFSILNYVSVFDQVSSIDFLLRKIWLERLDYIDYIAVSVGLSKVRAEVVNNFICDYQNKTRPTFPIIGDDLLLMGLHGVRLGESLGYLRNSWIASNFKLTKEQLLQLL